MLKNKCIVLTALQPWDGHIGCNAKDMALELSKYNKVLYVNAPLDLITRMRGGSNEWVKKRIDIVKGKASPVEQINENLWTLFPKRMINSINFLPDNGIYDMLNKRNNKSFAKDIAEAMDELDFSDPILFNDSLIFLGYYLPDLLEFSLSIYYIRDNLVTQSYFGRHGVRLEPLLAKKYDMVVSNSDFLGDYLRKYNKSTYMIGQGCNLTAFDPHKSYDTPEDMLDIPRPITGYLGNLISMRLDLALIEHLAENINGSVVLVGPQDEDFKNSKLHSMDNVFFLGNKPEETVPSYINAFDVCINPQAKNEMTIGNYPRKIDEYLAMGKPVVATYTPAMEYFGDNTYLAPDYEEYARLIYKAIEEDSPERRQARIECANSHSWEGNIRNIEEAIQKYESN